MTTGTARSPRYTAEVLCRRSRREYSDMGSLPYALTSCTISSQLFAVINFMLSPTIALPMSIIVVVLLLTYLVTLADSAVLIINTIAAGGDARQKPKMHITVWGAALTPVIGALPFSIVMALMGIALFKAVIRDGIRARHSESTANPAEK